MDFPPSKLVSGSGEYVCLVLDHLANQALKKTGFTFRRYFQIPSSVLPVKIFLAAVSRREGFIFSVSLRPNYPEENQEEESVINDDAELTLSKVEEEMIVSVSVLVACFKIFGRARASYLNSSINPFADF